MLFKKTFKHVLTTTGNKAVLFGVDLFQREWNYTGETVTVTDPLYGQEHDADVYTIEVRGKAKRFAATEFSNGVWGFYVKQ